MRIYYRDADGQILRAVREADLYLQYDFDADFAYSQFEIPELAANKEICKQLDIFAGSDRYTVVGGQLLDGETPVSVAQDGDLSDYKGQYVAAVARLEQVRDSEPPAITTNAEAIAAIEQLQVVVQDIAKYQLWIFKFIKNYLVR